MSVAGAHVREVWQALQACGVPAWPTRDRQDLDRPLAVFNIDSLLDDTFIELLSDLPQGAILLFEDVDSMFRSDRKSAGEGGMTFSAMLNALDGALDRHCVARGVSVASCTSCLPMRSRRARCGAVPSRATIRPGRCRGGGLSPARLMDVLFRVRDAPPQEAGNALVKELREDV